MGLELCFKFYIRKIERVWFDQSVWILAGQGVDPVAAGKAVARCRAARQHADPKGLFKRLGRFKVSKKVQGIPKGGEASGIAGRAFFQRIGEWVGQR